MSKNPGSTARRALGIAALSGLALAAAPAAHAASRPDSTGSDETAPTAHQITENFADVPLYPIAGSPFDLLTNAVHVPVGGMDLSTLPVTAPFKHGLPLRDVPVVGALLP
jgi:hypothetical protein